MPTDSQQNEQESLQEQSFTAEVDPEENLDPLDVEENFGLEGRQANIDVQDKDVHSFSIVMGGNVAGDNPTSWWTRPVFIAHRPVKIVKIIENRVQAAVYGSGDVLWNLYKSVDGDNSISNALVTSDPWNSKAGIDMEITAGTANVLTLEHMDKFNTELPQNCKLFSDLPSNYGSAGTKPAGVFATVYFKYTDQGTYNE